MKLQTIGSWIQKSVVKPFLDVYLLREANSNEEDGFTSVHAKWNLFCILGAFDLFNLRLQALSASNPESEWIREQLKNFQTAVENLRQTGLLDGSFEQTASDFMQFMNRPEDFHGHWKDLLVSTKFDEKSFGYWIAQNAPLIPWNGRGENKAASDLSFYTVLFFADLENLFVGQRSNIDAYWLSSLSSERFPMYSISAQLLISYYYELAHRPARGSSGWDAFMKDIQYLGDVINHVNFSFAPSLSGSRHNQVYPLFFSKFNFFWQEIERSSPSLLFASVSAYSSLFEAYSAALTPANLESFGMQIDDAVTMYHQRAS